MKTRNPIARMLHVATRNRVMGVDKKFNKKKERQDMKTRQTDRQTDRYPNEPLDTGDVVETAIRQRNAILGQARVNEEGLREGCSSAQTQEIRW